MTVLELAVSIILVLFTITYDAEEAASHVYFYSERMI